MSDIIKWFRQDEQKIVLREEYQRQRIALPDLRQVLHRDTSDSQIPERLQRVMPVKTLEQITGSDQTRFAEAMVASTSKTITGMVCDMVGSDGKQTEGMTYEDITRAANKLVDCGITGTLNCVMSTKDYSRLIWSLHYLTDRSKISEDEHKEISHMINQCGYTNGLRKGSWRGVGIYVANRCTRSFVFGQGAIQYSERRDDLLITNFVVENPREQLIDLGDLVLGLHRKPFDLEVDVIGHYWPTVSIANKDAIVFIQTEKT